MLSALASLVLGVAVVGTQSGPAGDAPQASGAGAAALPTPFDVPTQALAFVQLTADGLAIYQTTVDRVCPPAAIDCAEVSTTGRRVVAAPDELTAVSLLNLHEANGRLALLTIDDRGNESVSVVMLPRAADPVPPFGGPLHSDGPLGPTPAVSVAFSPRPISPKPGPGDTAGASPTSSDDPTRSGEPALPTSDPSSSPSSRPSAEAPTSEPGQPSPVESPSLALPSSSPVPEAMQAILEDVRVMGAPPSWSSDGEMLAFSAMPADASSGPDVYTWRSGDTRAERLTDDGNSYFSSWSGRRVVVSRPETSAASENSRTAITVVIDPATDLERSVEGDGGWLPAVDPAGRLAITWHGELAADGPAVVPLRGALSIVDWRAIDPFAADGGSVVTGAPDTGAGARAGASDEPEEPARAKRRGERKGKRQASPTAEAPPGASGVSASSETSGSPGASGSSGSPGATQPTAAASPVSSQGVLVEPDRQPSTDPVREWQVSWSADSSAFGFWVTETPGADWGRLAVLGVERASASIDDGSVLLPPTLARRSFTLGRDRVAWVAPSEDRPEGELRLRTWGPRGYGSLRIPEFDVSTGLPAF